MARRYWPPTVNKAGLDDVGIDRGWITKDRMRVQFES